MIAFREADNKDMFTVMDIRNSGRELMTHDTHEITYEEQYDWWRSPRRQEYKIWLVELDIATLPLYTIGFCAIHNTWITVCLYPEYRGKGYAIEIYEFLAKQADELWTELRRNNLSLLYAALNAGFVACKQEDGIVTLRKEDT